MQCTSRKNYISISHMNRLKVNLQKTIKAILKMNKANSLIDIPLSAQ